MNSTDYIYNLGQASERGQSLVTEALQLFSHFLVYCTVLFMLFILTVHSGYKLDRVEVFLL